MKILRTDSADIKVSDRRKQLAKIRINRTPQGLKVYFKSKVICDMFKEQSQDQKADVTVRDHNGDEQYYLAYNVNSIITEGSLDGSIIGNNMRTALASNWNSIAYDYDYDRGTCTPNIGFTTLADAKNGITVQLYGTISNRQFDCYVESVNRYVEWLWQTFCVDKESETVLSSSQVLKIQPRGN